MGKEGDGRASLGLVALRTDSSATAMFSLASGGRRPGSPLAIASARPSSTASCSRKRSGSSVTAISLNATGGRPWKLRDCANEGG